MELLLSAGEDLPRQLNDCDATWWYTDTVRGEALGLSKAGDCSFVARPAVPKDQLRQVVRTFLLRDEFTLLSVIGWIFLRRDKSVGIPGRRETPTENMSEFGQARPHSVLGMVGRRLALKLRRRNHMVSSSILKRSRCC